jgi:hypothetical protein
MAGLQGYGEAMPQQLFVFIQLEFPWALGPADGRYLLRRGPGAEPERVVVLGTLEAGRQAIGGRPGGSGTPRPLLNRLQRRTPSLPTTPDPAPVATTRVTVIDPVSLSAENQARAWLAELDRDREVGAAVAIVNRVVHSHRIASADPYVHEISPAQALVIRAGWGEGEQVADGRWLHARALPWPASDRGSAGLRRTSARSRSSALRPQERLAVLLGARGVALLCEELTLRARQDLDHGRPAHAAIELEQALTLALGELRAEHRQDLAIRLAELEQLAPDVQAQAQAVLGADGDGPDQDVLAHALERLEATLRARTASGV